MKRFNSKDLLGSSEARVYYHDLRKERRLKVMLGTASIRTSLSKLMGFVMLAIPGGKGQKTSSKLIIVSILTSLIRHMGCAIRVI